MTRGLDVDGRGLGIASRAVGPSTTDAIPDSGGTHQWNFDEGSGDTAADYIGSLDGSLNGPSWDSGVGVGDYVLDFRGGDHTVSLGDASRSELTHFTDAGEGTLLIWVHFDSLSEDTSVLFGHEFAAAEVGALLSVNDSGEVVTRADDGWDTMWSVSGGDVPTDEWTLVGFTADGSDVRVYYVDVDVTEGGSGSISGGTSNDWSNDAQFGGSTADTRYADCRMDVPMVDDTAWSESEIQDWYDDTIENYQ